MLILLISSNCIFYLTQMTYYLNSQPFLHICYFEISCVSFYGTMGTC